MITGSAEYQEFLATIAQTYQPPDIAIRIPTDEPVYEVDLNRRTIETPPFLGVEADHEAELIYFKMDRFYDSMDLASCVGIVQFQNAKHEEYFYVIPYYDTVSIPGKMIFAWDIQSPVTKYGGLVSFSFKFFKVDTFDETPEVIYELNTLVARCRVLVGWATKFGANHTYDQLTADKILLNNEFLQKLNYLEAVQANLAVYWRDV